MISFFLNLPYTLIGLIMGLISVPKSLKWHPQPYTFILEVRKFWWQFGYMKGMRAATIGQVVLLGPKLEANDLEHELIHVEQYQAYPFIMPFLYYFELFRKGYRNNRFEEEAYRRAGNIYKE